MAAILEWVKKHPKRTIGIIIAAFSAPLVLVHFLLNSQHSILVKKLCQKQVALV